jgi:hypothetical protein
MEAGETRETEAKGARQLTSPVCEVVRDAHRELRSLMQQRVELMQRIGSVKKTIAGLAVIFGEKESNEKLYALIQASSGTRKPGFTMACRTILIEADHAMTAREVRDQIFQRFPDLLAGHKDPVASVTTILNRLVNYGEAQRNRLADNRRAWQWVTEVSRDRSVLEAAAVSSLPPTKAAGAARANHGDASPGE